MNSATIRLPLETKRRLARLAKTHGTTPGAVIENLLRQAEEDAQWRDLGDSYRKSSNRDLARTAHLVAQSSRRTLKHLEPS